MSDIRYILNYVFSRSNIDLDPFPELVREYYKKLCEFHAECDNDDIKKEVMCAIQKLNGTAPMRNSRW